MIYSLTHSLLRSILISKHIYFISFLGLFHCGQRLFFIGFQSLEILMRFSSWPSINISTILKNILFLFFPYLMIYRRIFPYRMRIIFLYSLLFVWLFLLRKMKVCPPIYQEYRKARCDKQYPLKVYFFAEELSAPIKKGEVLGGVDIYVDGKLCGNTTLVAANDVESNGFLAFMTYAKKMLVSRAFIIFFIV